MVNILYIIHRYHAIIYFHEYFLDDNQIIRCTFTCMALRKLLLIFINTHALKVYFLVNQVTNVYENKVNYSYI